jgi:hypothetical protein
MATVELRGWGQQVTERLPSVCACCGQPAVISKEKKFEWFPKWTYLLIALGVLPFVIVMLITRKVMTVRVPLCEKHRRPWLELKLVAGLFLFVLLAPLFVGVILAPAVGKIGEDGSAVLLGGWVLLCVVVMIGFFVVAMRSIRPKRITNDRIILAGVSPEFAGAVGAVGAVGADPPEPLTAPWARGASGRRGDA